MAPTFDHVNVYWATNSEENAAALEEVLPRVGFSLRHELSQLRVMGVVPRIYFVRGIVQECPPSPQCAPSPCNPCLLLALSIS